MSKIKDKNHIVSVKEIVKSNKWDALDVVQTAFNELERIKRRNQSHEENHVSNKVFNFEYYQE